MKRVEVAAAVMLRPDGSFLLGRRPPGGFYSGYWEFPGGKVEVGESPRDALVRELQEELGITVEQAHPWITREFRYEHADVRLHFFRVLRWTGELRLLQHDAIEWQRAGSVTVAPLLPANAPVLAALALPDFYAISRAAEIGVERQLAALGRVLASGLRLLQVREAALPPEQRAAFAAAAIGLCRRFGARALVNADLALAENVGADGVHLTAAQLLSLSRRPGFPLVAASCHDGRELAQATSLGLDFVVLGPIKETASHPGRPGMGWKAFAALAADYPLPIFALGGLAAEDREAAWAAGAHGVAAIRAAWE
ncbi:CTP pyrophosphohydrolase [mine drainage metagenome]|uniref:8-oxo-dGTP diphosphatase n=1 Tax=mine drainage metagenome TaxID=410659 RepID=A0A1J5SZ23_9ZZZZ